jgi:hypothetical protein
LRLRAVEPHEIDDRIFLELMVSPTVIARIVPTDALGIESEEVANYCFSKTGRTIASNAPIGEWLQSEARFLAS